MPIKCRFYAVLLTFVFIFAVPGPASAAEYTGVYRNTKARVLQVIDGDALKVELSNSQETALIRLAGIDTQGNNEAFDYMAGALLGREIDIQLDGAWNGALLDGRWTPAYVYGGNVFYNRTLLQRGYARVDSAYAQYTHYNTFINDERGARSRKAGLWASGNLLYGYTSYSYTGGTRVNLNTATASQIQNEFDGITSSETRAIVSYRENSPFRNQREIKFSGAFTRDEFEEYAGRMVVCTNLNTASTEELRQLTGITASEAREIVNFRNKTAFSDPYQLYSEDLITREKYNKIEPYVSVYDTDWVEHAIPDKTADLNRDTAETIHTAGSDSGMTLAKARQIADGRGNGYTLKWLGEIKKVSGTSLSDDQLNGLSDNLLTDQAHDMLSVPAFVNLNTASINALLEAGFDSSQASVIRRAQSRRMRTGRDIPINLGSLDAVSTLYTNINATTTVELMSLSESMTPYFASVLADAATRQPFGTSSELSDFFDYYEESALYNEIREYIILR